MPTAFKTDLKLCLNLDVYNFKQLLAYKMYNHFDYKFSLYKFFASPGKSNLSDLSHFERHLLTDDCVQRFLFNTTL